MTEHTLCEISDDIRRRLNELREKTDIGPFALLKGQRDRMPDGISGAIVAAWLNGDRREARSDQLDFVINLWEQKDDPAYYRVDLTDEHLNELACQRLRTGVDAKTFFKPPYTPPNGLHIHHVHNWTRGGTRSARRDHLEYVLGAWRALPDVCEPEPEVLGVEGYQTLNGRIVLDDALIARLRDLRERTGCSATALLAAAKQMGRAIPPGLKVPEIARWLSGQAKSADPACLLLVVETYGAMLRDESALPGTQRVPITEDIREGLKRERERTGIMQADLLRGATDAPDGLSAPMISNWINGTTNTARRDHVEYVVRRWEGLPDTLI